MNEGQVNYSVVKESGEAGGEGGGAGEEGGGAGAGLEDAEAVEAGAESGGEEEFD